MSVDVIWYIEYIFSQINWQAKFMETPGVELLEISTRLVIEKFQSRL